MPAAKARAAKKLPAVADAAAPRDSLGRFPVGVSGNPAGRPKGTRNEITQIVQELELAVRRSIRPDRIARIVEKLIAAAERGNMQAARLLLDKVLPNARSGEHDVDGLPSITIRIENATSGVRTIQGQASEVVAGNPRRVLDHAEAEASNVAHTTEAGDTQQ